MVKLQQWNLSIVDTLWSINGFVLISVHAAEAMFSVMGNADVLL